MPSDTTKIVQLNIRVPSKIDAALEKAAKNQRRSKNAQALVILEDWLKQLEAEAKTERQPAAA
jgi:hypothetical protein